MLTSEQAAWRNPRLLLTLLLVFLAGGLVGAMAMRERERVARLIFRPSASVQLSYDDLERTLKLTPTQSRNLKSILDDTYRYNQDLQMQIEDLRATGKNRIRAILEPEQRDQFDKLCTGKRVR